MRLEDMILVSVDDHVVEPPTMFDQHLAPEWKDKAPRVVAKNGTDVWIFQGQPIPRSTASSPRPTTRCARAATTSASACAT